MNFFVDLFYGNKSSSQKNNSSMNNNNNEINYSVFILLHIIHIATTRSYVSSFTFNNVKCG